MTPNGDEDQEFSAALSLAGWNDFAGFNLRFSNLFRTRGNQS
jgi:hypothetical protein